MKGFSTLRREGNIIEDKSILSQLYDRKEAGLQQLAAQYGTYCMSIALRIVSDREDAEECVNDVWQRVWEAAPTARPDNLRLYLASVTRNLAFDRYRRQHTAKRGSGTALLALEELGECADTQALPEDSALRKELSESIRAFVLGLRERDRRIFLYRYFYAAAIREISQKCGLSENNVTVILNRIRKKLKSHLIKEGYLT